MIKMSEDPKTHVIKNLSTPGNRYTTLEHGQVYYSLTGPSSGKIIVMIHGLTMASYVWDKTEPDLVSLGYRVLKYDLYGRGNSEKPLIAYNETLYITQLYQLLEKLSLLPEKLIIIGVSLGAAIAVLFTEKYSHLIEKLILISPAGFPISLRHKSILLGIPWIKKLVMNKFGKRIILNETIKAFYHPLQFPEISQKIRKNFEEEGYLHSVFSTLTEMKLYSMQRNYELIGYAKISTLIIMGEYDQIVPIKKIPQIKRAIPDAELIIIEKTCHIPQYEQELIVNESIVRFLNNK
jgi:pimeloyl-ACP methyl ester carboxylesterase